MEQIYLDYGATSFPKAPGVADAMHRYLQQQGVNVGRSSYGASIDVALTVLQVRRRLCSLLGYGGDPRCCVFSSGVTMSLNLLLQGFLRPGDHWIISAMEHNAVARVAQALQGKGVAYSVAPCDAEGRILTEEFVRLLRPQTRLAAIQHVSNVSGTIQPLAELGRICRASDIALVADCAQSAGHLPVRMDDWGLSAVAFPGHKGLLGPQGIGGMILTETMAQQLQPLLFGGTGSRSDSLDMPLQLPDRLEAGTLNLPGIVGLGAALEHISIVGVEALRTHELALTQRFMDALRHNSRIRLPGTECAAERTGVVSVEFRNRDNGEAADRLEREYGVLTRCGLHCAPLAHQTLGTFPQGTVRFSFGPATTTEQLDRAVAAIEAIC